MAPLEPGQDSRDDDDGLDDEDDQADGEQEAEVLDHRHLGQLQRQEPRHGRDHRQRERWGHVRHHRVDGHRRYKCATFPAPRTLGTLPPQEAWAPGMTKSLQDLRREIENDGWVEAGRGTDPWAFRYGHPASG